MQRWRWDQGRLEYFKFENIRKTAETLAALDGVVLAGGEDPLKRALQAATGLQYRPPHYRAWRNYKRIFTAEMLATEVDGRLTVTDLCRGLCLSGNSYMDVDDFFAHIVPRFYYPYPGFRGYVPGEPQVFPFCAVLKYLLATLDAPMEASLSTEDVFSLIIGNNCNGREAVESYRQLRRTEREPTDEDEKRQVREMMAFLGQSSFLKWNRQRLYLDILPGDKESADALERIATPIEGEQHPEANRELLRLGQVKSLVRASTGTTRRQPADVLFTEGKQIRVTHLRIERSPQLRQMYFSSLTQPYLCNMCRLDPKSIYPWTDNILEVHHLLPLSSALTVLVEGTSLSDIVALCPNCHKSVHTYYKLYLNQHGLDDFRSKDEAIETYSKAKGEVACN